MRVVIKTGPYQGLTGTVIDQDRSSALVRLDNGEEVAARLDDLEQPWLWKRDLFWSAMIGALLGVVVVLITAYQIGGRHG